METPAVVQATPRIDARFASATTGNEKRAAVQQRPSGASSRRPPVLTVLTGTNCPVDGDPSGARFTAREPTGVACIACT